MAHAAGAVEDFVGAHDTAKATRSLGDQGAAEMGVQVGEKQLGETEFPNELVHGDPDEIEKAEQVLTKYAHAYERIGEGLRGIDAHDWQGASADKFRATRDKHAKDWHKGADSYQQAASAMQAHRHTVIWGQKQAGEAIRLWNQAKQERKDAADSHNEKIKQYNEAAAKFNQAAKDGKSGKPPAAPGEFQDPSGDTKAQATAILKHAREQVHTSNGEVKSKLDAACDLAPPIPPKSVQKKQIDQAVHAAQNEPAKHMLSGLTDSASSTIGIVRGGMPFDPYNMTHPSEYADHMSSQAAGMVQLGNHPSRLVKSIAHEWKSDPAHAAGELVGDLVGGGGAGGVAKTGAKAVGKEAAKTAGKAAGKDAGKDAGKEAGKDAGRAGEHAAKHGLDNAGHGLGKIGRELRDLDNRMHDPGKVDRGHTPDPAQTHQPPPKTHTPGGTPAQQFNHAGQNMSRIEQRLAGLDERMHDPGPTHRRTAEANPPDYSDPRYRATKEDQQRLFDKYDPSAHESRLISEARGRAAGRGSSADDAGILASRKMLDVNTNGPVQKALRNGDQAALKEHDALIRNHVDTVARARRHHGKTYRGIELHGKELHDMLEQLKTGHFKDPAFVSSDKAAGHPGNVQFEISSNTGHDVSWLRPGTAGDQEVIHLPNTPFQVDKIEPVDLKNNRWKIHLTDSKEK